MNEIKIFENNEFGKVRIIDVNGEPWFVGSDVAKLLGYARPNDAITAHCKGTVKHRIGVQTGVKADGTPALQNVEMSIIPERDVYRLVMRSKLPQAEKFEEWVVGEILPTIRKHGAYMTDNTIEKALTNPDFLIQLATKLKEEKEARAKAEATIVAQKPKVLFADSVSASKQSILVGELAKLIKQNGVDIGQNRLFKWLRANGYIQRTKNEPTQRSMELNVMEVKVRTINNPDGSTRITRTPMITGKGQIYFVNKFLNSNCECSDEEVIV